MRNLLSEQTKHELTVEYWSRFIIVGVIFLSITCGIGIISLFPSYILLKTNSTVAQSKASFFRDQKDNEGARINDAVRTTKVELELLGGLGHTGLFSERMKEIILGQPEGITVDHIMFTSQKKEDERLFTMGGVATTRDALLSLERLLKQQPDFTAVTFPVSNLSHDRNIPFSVTARGAF